VVKVARPEDLDNLAFAVANDLAETFAPLDGFFERGGLDHGKASRQLFEFDSSRKPHFLPVEIELEIYA